MPNLDDELKNAPTAGEEAVVDGGVETIARDTPYDPTPQNTPRSPLRWKNIEPYAMPAFQGAGIGLLVTGFTIFDDVLASSYFGSNTLLTRETPGAMTLMMTTLFALSSMMKKTDEKKPFGFYLTMLATQSATMYGALVATYKIVEIAGVK